MHSTVWYLGYHKVCSYCVPSLLTDTYKDHQMSMPLENLQPYHTQDQMFMWHTVAGNATTSKPHENQQGRN
jgi:hypothetical protein